MRTLKLHVNDMDFLVNEMMRSADKYHDAAVMYGGRRLRAIKDPEEKAERQRMVNYFKRQEKKANKIAKAMREQGCHYR